MSKPVLTPEKVAWPAHVQIKAKPRQRQKALETTARLSLNLSKVQATVRKAPCCPQNAVKRSPISIIQAVRIAPRHETVKDIAARQGRARAVDKVSVAAGRLQNTAPLRRTTVRARITTLIPCHGFAQGPPQRPKVVGLLAPALGVKGPVEVLLTRQLHIRAAKPTAHRRCRAIAPSPATITKLKNATCQRGLLTIRVSPALRGSRVLSAP